MAKSTTTRCRVEFECESTRNTSMQGTTAADVEDRVRNGSRFPYPKLTIRQIVSDTFSGFAFLDVRYLEPIPCFSRALISIYQLEVDIELIRACILNATMPP